MASLQNSDFILTSYSNFDLMFCLQEKILIEFCFCSQFCTTGEVQNKKIFHFCKQLCEQVINAFEYSFNNL